MEQAKATDGVRQAITNLEARMDRRFEHVDHRFERIEDKLSRHFLWLVGLQVTTLAAIVAAFAAK